MTRVVVNKVLLEQAIDALETYGKQYPHMQKGYLLDAEQSLRAALVEPAVEPAAWVLSHSQGIDDAAKRVLAQRDELLAVLKSVLNWIDDNCETSGFDVIEAQADAAIAKAGGEV